MKKLILQTLFASAILACASCSELDVSLSESQMTDAIQSRSLSTNLEYYYYYRGKKIPLKVHPTKRYVVVEEGGSESVKPLGFKEEQNSYYVNKTQRGYIVDVDTAQTIKVSSNLNTLNSLTQNDNIVAIEYVIGDSILTPVSNEFYVKLKKLSDISLLEKYAKAIGCELEGAIESDNYWICLTSNKNSMLNSLEASNFMYETGHFAKVDPGFLLKFEDFSTPSDPDYNLQWNMHSTYGIKANYAWNITKGSSDIIVAVLEGGIYTEHPDLVNRITDSYDAVNNSTPYIYTDHATKVAGVIASNHNDLFIAGVAPFI